MDGENKKLSSQIIRGFTSQVKHVCLKKKVAANCDQVREDDTSAKTDAHINYDTKYEMIHNFFLSRLKKYSTHFGWILLRIKALGLGAYTIFKQNP